MDATTLKTYDKTTLKNIALERGLSRNGFNGRNISRMRKQDFIDFIMFQEEDPDSDSDMSTVFHELLDDFLQPIVHIMGALTGNHSTSDEIGLNVVHIFERISNEGKKEALERIPNEEDEIVPTLSLKEMVAHPTTIECQCKICTQNQDINIENLKVQLAINNLETKIRCVVCQTNIRNMVFNPCNHLATCISCFKNPLLNNKCPLCRKRFESATRIFC
jgi:hypothetical protein